MKPDLEALWRDPNNWSKSQYRCADDPRLCVPRQQPWRGMTINWAHPRSTDLLIGTIAMVLVPLLVAVTLSVLGVFGRVPMVVPVAIATTIAAVCNFALAKRLSRPPT